MVSVSISSKYQIVIPLEIRKALNIKPGEELIVLPYQNRIEYIKKQDLKKLRGAVKGIDTSVNREIDRI